MKNTSLFFSTVLPLLLFVSLAGGTDRGTIESGVTGLDYALTAPDAKDRFLFTGQKSQHVLVNAVTTGGSLNTMLSLYAPSGAKEAYTFLGGDKLDWTLKEDGPYTIVVEDYTHTNLGDYAISFLNLPGGPVSYSGDADGGAITSGETRTWQNQYFLGYGRLSVHRRERSAHPC